MSDEADETKKTAEQLPSIVAIAGVCCGALFGSIISGLEKLVELEWASKPFWLLTDALMAEIFLFTVSCIVFAFSFFKARKKRAAN